MKHLIKISLLLLFSIAFINSVYAADVALKPNHPTKYVVKKGDTLWDISNKFLQKPWQWQELRKANPDVKDPNRIYPGDILVLKKVKGKTVLEKAPSYHHRFHHHVKAKAEPMPDIPPLVRKPIPAIPYQEIKPFLRGVQVVTNEAYDQSPYIVGIDEMFSMATTDDKIYVRRLKGRLNTSYAIFRNGKPYIDPQTHESLGYRAVHVGDARLIRTGDPSTLRVTNVREEISVGDRIMSNQTDPNKMYFNLRAPRTKVSGQIISELDDASRIAPYQIIAIDRGTSNGIRSGDVLAVYHPGELVPDRMLPKEHHVHPQMVKLPDERIGEIVVFRTFKRVSYALAIGATREAHILDIVTNPK